MKKVAILTLNGNYNYGNKLQNYALQQVIRKLGFECETIINNTDNNITSKEKNKIYEFKGKSFKEKFKILFRIINKKNRDQLIKKRTEKFINFSQEYLAETNFSINKDHIPSNLSEMYDYFISGSDQVWNPNDSKVSEVNFITFAPIEKRITYAPSFGVSKIPKRLENSYKVWLSGINNISVREDEGAKIIKHLTGKDSLVVVDPTMLLLKEEWLNVQKIHEKKPKEKYLLTYFLGGINKRVKEKIDKIAKENNLKIVNLSHIRSKKYYDADPNEFINYINDAEVFITDSFHGCVFSVLLETPFIVCDRDGHTEEENMNSRIKTFIKKFQLESRDINNIKQAEILSCNYQQANKILEVEREKAWKYLKSTLKVDS